MFLGLLYPDPLVRGTDPDPDPFIKLEKDGFLLFCDFFMTFILRKSMYYKCTFKK
jgi:hypothetical protein